MHCRHQKEKRTERERKRWRETAVLTDSRIRTMNEVVSGIRIIKMYAWEKPFAALVSEVRR